MKFSEEMRFPHPVMSADTGDYESGEFDIKLTITEVPATNSVSIAYTIDLNHDDLLHLVQNGGARVGLFVRCEDTYFTRLCELGWPSGSLEFEPDQLLNRVTLKPLMWTNSANDDWTAADVHPEFTMPIKLEHGDILALGLEKVIFAGKAKLAPLESIFKLSLSEDIPENELRVNLESDKINILAAAKTHEMIVKLRFDQTGRAALLNGVYLPAVMEVLAELSDNGNAFEGCRWYHPFAAKCGLLGVDLDDPDLLRDAQRLLGGPSKELFALTTGDA